MKPAPQAEAGKERCYQKIADASNEGKSGSWRAPKASGQVFALRLARFGERIAPPSEGTTSLNEGEGKKKETTKAQL